MMITYTQEEKLNLIKKLFPLFEKLMRLKNVPYYLKKDCKQAMIYTVLKSLNKWNPDLAPLATYVWKALLITISNFLTENLYNSPLQYIENIGLCLEVNPYKYTQFDLFLDSLNYIQELYLNTHINDTDPKSLLDLSQELNISVAQLRYEINNLKILIDTHLSL